LIKYFIIVFGCRRADIRLEGDKMARDVTIELEQRGPLSKKRVVQLLDNRELYITEENKRSRKDYSIDLLALDSQRRRRIHLAWPWLLSLLFILIPLIVLLLIPEYFAEYSSLPVSLVVLPGGLVTAVCLYMFWINSSRRHCFVSRHANIPLVVLDTNKPDRKEVSEFVAALEQYIKQQQEQYQLSDQQQLSGEMRMLRRLTDKKILSETDYEQAKEKLLDRFD